MRPRRDAAEYLHFRPEDGAMTCDASMRPRRDAAEYLPASFSATAPATGFNEAAA